MNISPVSFTNFRANFRPSIQAQIKKAYPDYKPDMKDDAVVSWCSCGPNYIYPFTAKQVREEIKRLEQMEAELEAKEKEEEAFLEEYMENTSEEQKNTSSCGPNYIFHTDTDSY